MRAAIFEGGGKISVGEREAPDPQAGEVRLAVTACALCGSDLRLFREGASWIPGHEIIGRVAARGHALDGRRALVYIPVFCGACARCRAGDTHLCVTDPDLIGWNRPGGYAEALNVPERCLLPVPEDIPDELAPLLLDVIGTTAHAVRLARKLVSGGRALVLGAGPIGLGAILSARALGFSALTVSEPQHYRRDLALSLGAAPWDGEAGGFDLVLEFERAGRGAAGGDREGGTGRGGRAPGRERDALALHREPKNPAQGLLDAALLLLPDRRLPGQSRPASGRSWRLSRAGRSDVRP